MLMITKKILILKISIEIVSLSTDYKLQRQLHVSSVGYIVNNMQ